MKEKLFNQLIEEFYAEKPNNFNFREKERINTIRLLQALKGFHSEEGTTQEQDELLIASGLKAKT